MAQSGERALRIDWHLRSCLVPEPRNMRPAPPDTAWDRHGTTTPVSMHQYALYGQMLSLWLQCASSVSGANARQGRRGEEAVVVLVARADAQIRKDANSLLCIVLQHAFNGAGSCISGGGSLSITLCG